DPEMRDIDAARESVDAGVPVALRLVEAVAAGEDEIGAPQELLLALEHDRRRATEGGELVHAVIDDGARLDMVGEGAAHRRVVPKDRPGDAVAGDEPVNEAA